MSSDPTRRVLDARYIRARRQELGYSQRALARKTGIGQRRLLELERRGIDEDLNLRELANLADGLACPIAQLLAEPPPAPPPGCDDVRIEALLMSAGRVLRGIDVRAVLEVSDSEWRDAIAALKARLAATGIALAEHGQGGFSLVPRVGVVTAQQVEQLRKRPGRSGSKVTLSDAQLLKRVLDGDLVDAGRFDGLNFRAQTAFGYLKRNGLIVVDDSGTIEIPHDIKFSLGLTNRRPPRRRRRD